MAKKKLLYFLAGMTPTATETTNIGILNNLCAPGYEVFVRNNAKSTSSDPALEPCDLVAGQIPTAYNGVTAYGSISASRPHLFNIWPKTKSVSLAGGLNVNLYPAKVTGDTLSDLVAAAITSGVAYASSDEDVAVVHETNGTVSPIGVGVCTITATYTYATGKTSTATSVITVTT